MKKMTLLLLPFLLWSCQKSEPPALPDRPHALSSEERSQIDAALSTQVIGQELAGRTSWLSAEGFTQAPLDKAPKFYLLYFSASW